MSSSNPLLVQPPRFAPTHSSRLRQKPAAVASAMKVEGAPFLASTQREKQAGGGGAFLSGGADRRVKDTRCGVPGGAATAAGFAGGGALLINPRSL
jgi:hypothetical protein